jgi:citrate synthase
VPVLAAVSRDNGYYGVHWRLLMAIEAVIAGRRGRKLPLNGAGAMGAMYAEMGLSPLLARGFALVGRCAGIVAHLLEEEQTPIAQDVWQLVLAQDHRSA